MANTEEIIVKFRTEGGREVEETFARAGDAGEKFHSTVTKTSSGLEDLRLKSEARVARNIGEIAQSMLSGASAGDVLATSITAAAESFRGFLLYAAAATTGAALYQGITRLGEAVIKFQEAGATLRRESLIPGEFLGADRVNKSLDQTIERIGTLEDVSRRARLDVGALMGVIVTAVQQGAPGGNILAPQIAKILGPILGAVQRFTGGQIGAEQATAVREAGQLTDIMNKANEQIDESVRGSELRARLAGVETERTQKLFDLRERFSKAQILDTAQAQEALRATESHYDLIEQGEIKRSVLQTEGLRTQEQINEIQSDAQSQDQESLRILDARIDSINRLLSPFSRITDEERAQLHVERDQLDIQKSRLELVSDLHERLAAIQLEGVTGELAPGEAQAAGLSNQLQYAAQRFGPDSPEAISAAAAAQEAGFRRYQQYQRNPAAYRAQQQQEQFERESYEYRRRQYWFGRGSVRTPTLDQLYGGPPPELTGITPVQNQQKENQQTTTDLVKNLQTLIQTLNQLPSAVGVG